MTRTALAAIMIIGSFFAGHALVPALRLLAHHVTNSHASDPGVGEGVAHSLNPGHLWILVYADHPGLITSGARYHDGCDSLDNNAGPPDYYANDLNSDGYFG